MRQVFVRYKTVFETTGCLVWWVICLVAAGLMEGGSGREGGGEFWGIYVISSPSIRVTKPATHVGSGDVNNFIPITTFLTASEAFIKF